MLLAWTRIRIANGTTLSSFFFCKVGLVLVKAAELTAQDTMDRNDKALLASILACPGGNVSRRKRQVLFPDTFNL